MSGLGDPNLAKWTAGEQDEAGPVQAPGSVHRGGGGRPQAGDRVGVGEGGAWVGWGRGEPGSGWGRRSLGQGGGGGSLGIRAETQP